MPPHKVSDATRKRFAELARLRQGPDGRWESNARKAMVRKAKRASMKIGPLFARARAKKAARDIEALRQAKALTRELEDIRDEAGLLQLVGRLNGISVTAAVLRRSSLPQALRRVVDRCPAVGRVAQPVLWRWRCIYRQEVDKVKAAATSPSAAVRAARAARAGAGTAAEGPCTPAAVRRRRSASASSSVSSSSSSSSTSSSSLQAPSSVAKSTPPKDPQAAPQRRWRRLRQKSIKALMAPVGRGEAPARQAGKAHVGSGRLRN